MQAICKHCDTEFSYDYTGSGRHKEYCNIKCARAFRSHRYYLKHRHHWNKKEVKNVM